VDKRWWDETILRIKRTRRHEDHRCTEVEDDLGLYAHTNHQSKLWHILGVLVKMGPIRTWAVPGLVGYLLDTFGDVGTSTGDNSARIKVREC
jgi:hypothetical protein